MRTHVKVLGALQLVFASISLLFALGVGMGFSLLGAFVGASGEPDAEVGSAVLGFVGVAAAGLFGIGGALGLASRIGLLKFRSWARILGIVCSAFSLISSAFPRRGARPVRDRGSPAATRSCSRTTSTPVTSPLTGCSTWSRVFISMKVTVPSGPGTHPKLPAVP